MRKAIFVVSLTAAIVVFFAAAMVMAGGTGLTEIKIYTNENPPRFWGTTPVGPSQAANYLGNSKGLPHVNGLLARIGMNGDVIPPDSNKIWATTDAAMGPYGIKYHFIGLPNPRTWYDIQRDDTPGYTQYLDASATERVTFWIKAQAGTKYPFWLRVRSRNHPTDGKDVEGAYVMIDGETIVKKDPFGNYFAFRDSAFNGVWQFVSIPWGFLKLDSAGVRSVIPYSLADPEGKITGKHVGGTHFDLKTIRSFTLDTKEGGSQLGYPWPSGTGTADYFVDEFVFTLEEGTGITGLDGKPTQMPLTYDLGNAYPNPFNPSTTIEYAIPVSNHVTLKIYDLLGREVRTLVDRYVTAGTYNVVWDGRDEAGNTVPSGAYLYQMRSSHYSQAKKLVLSK